MSKIRPDGKLEELHEMTRQEPPSGLPRIFYLLPAIHILIALPLAYHLNIWADEGSTLYTTEHGFFQTLQNTLNDEKQAPLYFLLMSLWREISSSIFFARLFSIVFSVLSIGLFFDICRRFWDQKTAIFATFFFALHPYLFWASLEIRVYSLVIFLSLVLLKLFFGGYLERRKTESSIKWRRSLFSITAIFSLYTNYYLGFLLVACFCVLLIFRRWRAARSYFLQMILVGFAIAPMLLVIKAQFAVNTGGHFQETNFIEGVRILWNHLLSFTLPTELFPPENQTLVSYARIWIVRIGIIGTIVSIFTVGKKRPNQRVAIFAIISAVVLGFLYLAYFSLSEIYIAIRHASVLFAPFILLLVAVFSQIVSALKKQQFAFLATLALLLTCFYAYGIFSIHPNFTKRGDWERVSKFIESNEKPDQPIIVFSNYEALTLPYHYRGKNSVSPKTNFFKWDYEAEFGAEEMWVNQIEFVISKIPKDKNEIWLVTEDGCQSTKGCLPLEKFVEENYTIVEKKDFYKERVRLLRKK